MAKKTDPIIITGEIVYDKDSKKGTYHRYQIVSDVGIVGNVYIPTKEEVPHEIHLINPKKYNVKSEGK